MNSTIDATLMNTQTMYIPQNFYRVMSPPPPSITHTHKRIAHSSCTLSHCSVRSIVARQNFVGITITSQSSNFVKRILDIRYVVFVILAKSVNESFI